jgi:hypothetical protein
MSEIKSVLSEEHSVFKNVKKKKTSRSEGSQ